MKICFRKLEHWLLVGSTKIENAIFTYKNALSEANVKTKTVGRTKMELSERIYLLINECKKVDLQITSMLIMILFVSAELLFEGGFSL